MLNATGLYGLAPLVEDGDWGPKTREAVEWFQKDRALPVDGKVDKATWAELLHLLASARHVRLDNRSHPLASRIGHQKAKPAVKLSGLVRQMPPVTLHSQLPWTALACVA